MDNLVFDMAGWIKKNVNLGIISWSNTLFSGLTLWELYDW